MDIDTKPMVLCCGTDTKLAVVLALLLIAGGIAAPIATARASGTGDPKVTQNVTFRLTPEDPGHITVEARYTIADDVDEVSIFPTGNATVVSKAGFERRKNGLRWTESTDRPSVKFRVAVNRSSPTFAGLDFADTGSWALAKFEIRIAFYSEAREKWVLSSENPTAFRIERGTHGPGYTGSVGVFFGNHSVYTRHAGNETFRLVVPKRAELATAPEKILAELAATSERHRTGGRHDEVVAFVAPSPLRGGGLSFGSRRSQRNIWVHESSNVEGTSVWIHEYVHTRQVYNETRSTRWLTEASAEYYASLYPLRDGELTYRGFRRLMSDNVSNAVLTNPSTWDDPRVPYARGALAVAALDARIRNASNGTATFEDVFRRLNDDTDGLTHAEFERIVESVAGTSLDGWIDRHVRGNESITFPEDPHVFTRPGGNGDADSDGLTAARERELGSHPFRADTDGDRLDDTEEIESGTNVTAPDTDGDELRDGREVRIETDPLREDTDGDGIADARELDRSTHPAVADTDSDGRNDSEDSYPTDPDLPDESTEETVADGDSRSRNEVEGSGDSQTRDDGGDGDSPETFVLVVAGLWIVSGLLGAISAVVLLAKGLDRVVGWGPRMLVKRSLRRLIGSCVGTLLLSLVILTMGALT